MGKANFSSFSSQARGVAILFTKNLALEIIENTIYNDPSGNFTVLNFKYENFVITLSCIYGPNQDNPAFYQNIVFPKTELCSEKSDFTIMGGRLEHCAGPKSMVTHQKTIQTPEIS